MQYYYFKINLVSGGTQNTMLQSDLVLILIQYVLTLAINFILSALTVYAHDIDHFVSVALIPGYQRAKYVQCNVGTLNISKYQKC